MGTGNYQIALLKEDGIGPEVIEAAVTVRQCAGSVHGFDLQYQDVDAGAQYCQRTGASISVASMESIVQADTVLLGAMGLPHVRKPVGTEIAPQIGIRKHYQLFCQPSDSQIVQGCVGSPAYRIS